MQSKANCKSYICNQKPIAIIAIQLQKIILSNFRFCYTYTDFVIRVCDNLLDRSNVPV